jgi:Cu/Ag efflux protein CusF
VKPIFLLLTFIACIACAHTEKSGPEKHYPVTGKIVSVNSKEQSALIDAAAIPNFMEAMTMDYPIKSKAEFESLHAGDLITGTLDVATDGIFTLSHIKIQAAAKK